MDYDVDGPALCPLFHHTVSVIVLGALELDGNGAIRLYFYRNQISARLYVARMANLTADAFFDLLVRPFV